jgi:hypothetical protein
VGRVITLEGDIDSVEKNLCQFRNVGQSKVVSISCINEIQHLLHYSAPTRFSSDIYIGKNKSEKLKIKILNYYISNFGKYFLGYKNKSNEIVGFHNAFITNNNTLNLYEINIMPSYRSGFAPIALISKNINTAKTFMPNIKKISTKIYETNSNSLEFFKKIGLNNQSFVESHYHLWLNGG